MLLLVTGDIALHCCDGLFFTRLEDFPERMRTSFDEILAFRANLETKAGWKPGSLAVQFRQERNTIIHANLGTDPDNMQVLKEVISKIPDAVAAIRKTSKPSFRSIAMPCIGDGLYPWIVVKNILKLFHSEPNPPANELDKKIHLEVYETDEPGKIPS